YKLPSQCGNGSVDTAAGEQCDPKAPNDPNAPYCTSECKIDECLKTSVDTASVAYQCCKAYRYPETQTSRKTFECCVANKGLLSAEQVNACLSATATTPVAYTREIAFLASPKTAEPAKTISVSAAYEAPALADIPWVEQMLPQEKTAVLGRKVALPTAGDDLTPPPPPDTQPADKCLEDFPDVNSQGYNCCKEYRPTRKIISRELRGTARPLANYFECCMAPENTDGVLDQAEIQACECKSRPDEPLCNCLGAHQADFLNGCLAAGGSTDKFTFVPEPPTYVYDLGGLNSKLGNRLKITLPACACAAPQTFQAPDDACGAIGNQRGFRVHDFPCLYPDQVKKAGYPAETVPEGYRITAPMSSDECVRLGGSAVSKVPAVIEGQTQNDVAVAALTAVDRADYLPVDRVSETQPANEVTCTFVKPACPCTPPPPPETQPETAPEEPPPPAPTTPEAKVAPEFRMAISGWGDSHAVLMDTAEVISLREATPELPRQAITSEAAFRLYKAYAEYDKNPNPENLAKLRAVVNENILGEVKETPHYGLMLLTPPPKDREDEGAAAVEADFAAIRAQFVKKAIELNPADGRLKVNAPEALEVLRSNAAALAADGEPEIVSMSQLFKTVSASGQPPIIEITVDAAQVSGGGCSLLR
ncbi:MAG TPA: hypothetical protein VLJ37_01925, partial [bacterium]|nr:hypothetical protein [bacterium]